MSTPPARPLIGLTTYAEQVRLGSRQVHGAALPLAYVRAVHASGGRAVLITTDDPGTDLLDRLDGIIFTGGADVDPARYGAPPHPTTRGCPERDTAELILLRGARAAGLPLLAICRGMQLMTVAYGGRLHQHLPDLFGHDGHRPGPGRFGSHPVTVAPGSLAYSILGDRLTVNSLHHQGVADPGGLAAVGWCPGDGLIEVVEDPALPFALGVQWHPEDTDDRRLFAALVAASRGWSRCRG